MILQEGSGTFHMDDIPHHTTTHIISFFFLLLLYIGYTVPLEERNNGTEQNHPHTHTSLAWNVFVLFLKLFLFSSLFFFIVYVVKKKKLVGRISRDR